MVEEANGGDNSTNLEDIDQSKGPSTSMEGWNTTWLSMPNTFHVEVNKY
jgi:hypothetical protein